MVELLLTADMIVRRGEVVIAAEVESLRAKKAHARAALKSIHNDPLWRARA